MKKQTTKKIRVRPSNSRKQLKKDLGFSVNKIISSKGVEIDLTDEVFSGGIIIDLSR
jgi:hypothetical protein